MSTPTDAPAPPAPPANDLGRLIETERRLAERLAAAEGEAQRIVEAARQAAREAEQALESELAGSVAALRLRVEGERDRRIAVLAAAARDRVERLDGIPPERIAALAELVLDRLLAGMVGDTGAAGAGPPP